MHITDRLTHHATAVCARIARLIDGAPNTPRSDLEDWDPDDQIDRDDRADGAVRAHSYTEQPGLYDDPDPNNGEQSVVVVLDLYADTHEDAARRVDHLLQPGGPCDVLAQPDVDAWWFPESRDKHIDRNDRDDRAAVVAAAWVVQRSTEAEAAVAISKAGILGGWLSPDDREPLHLDEAEHVVRALSDAGYRITRA
ncbi:hypothetical protein [Cellulomonas hominis]|uniref:hypothetical protein n=1 Tax=Cellulomonas hominis TaxID=156981 RepID=UPI001B8EF303|nr:hypothetical protein [Cellulomonas hominis]VTR76056.1 hypothetical protein CHMI_00812 [Cellulomonas hominis]